MVVTMLAELRLPGDDHERLSLPAGSQNGPDPGMGNDDARVCEKLVVTTRVEAEGPCICRGVYCASPTCANMLSSNVGAIESTIVIKRSNGSWVPTVTKIKGRCP